MHHLKRHAAALKKHLMRSQYQPDYLTSHLCKLGVQQGSLSVRSPLIMKDILLLLLLLSDLSQFPLLLFSLRGVEGIRVLPQVAGATDEAATSLGKRTNAKKEKGGLERQQQQQQQQQQFNQAQQHVVAKTVSYILLPLFLLLLLLLLPVDAGVGGF